MSAVLEIEGLRKTYKSRRRGVRNALDGFDMRVEAGQVHGFLGPNGSGKTTTLRTLLGLIQPDGGRMAHPRPGGARTRCPQVAGQVGAIVESPQFFPHFSARDTLSLLAEAGERPRRTGRRGAGTGRAAGPGRGAGQDLLARHEAAARRRVRPAQEPEAADPRRAGQRPRPGRHPGDAHPDAHPRRVRDDRGALQPHPRRDPADLRLGHHHLAGPPGRRRPGRRGARPALARWGTGAAGGRRATCRAPPNCSTAAGVAVTRSPTT